MSFSYSGDGQWVILMVLSKTRWFSLALKSCHDLGFFFPPHINIAAAFGFSNLMLPGSLVKSFSLSSCDAKGEVSAGTVPSQAVSPKELKKPF